MPNGAKDSGPAQPTEPTPESIAKRAYELFLQRGSVPGFELDDWLQAEAELVSIASVRKSRPAPATTNNRPAQRSAAHR